MSKIKAQLEELPEAIVIPPTPVLPSPEYFNLPIRLARPLLQQLDDLLVAAIEGGSTYWCAYCFPAGPVVVRKGKNWYEHAFQDGVSIRLRDQWNDEGEKLITLEVAKHGLDSLLRFYPRFVPAFMKDDMDAEFADCWLQMASFGRFVYG